MSGIVAQNTLDNSGLIKSPAGGGAWNFIAKQTASADATISFTSGIDSTYREYLFTFKNIHASANDAVFHFNVSIDAGSNYNVTKTTTYFSAQFAEAGDGSSLAYESSQDLAQSTAYQELIRNIGNGADESGAGTLWLFNPSNTTYVKHFYSVNNGYYNSDYSMNPYIGGYFNTTDNIDAIDFKVDAGNFDATIAMYGTG